MNPQDISSSHGFAARLAILVIGGLAYLGFHTVFLGLVAFLNELPPFAGAPAGEPRSLATALAINAGWVLLFGMQHAVMARAAFKRRWTRVIPEALERSVFVIATVICLGSAITFWQTVPGTIFHIESPTLRIALFVLQGAGWGILVWSTFLIDHFELFGLRQVWSAFRRMPMPIQQFRMPSLYRISRHPMMVGLLIGLWATPDMTADRLLFALGFSLYVLVGVRLEERELVEMLGDDYVAYQSRVGRFLSLPPAARDVEDSDTASVPA